MTPDDLNRAIAEKLGWTEMEPCSCYSVPPKMQGLDPFNKSPFKVHVPNFCTDPAMTVMLMEKLIRDGYKPFFIDLGVQDNIRLITGSPDGKGNHVDAPLGLAVAEAFARANGIYQEG